MYKNESSQGCKSEVLGYYHDRSPSSLPVQMECSTQGLFVFSSTQTLKYEYNLRYYLYVDIKCRLCLQNFCIALNVVLAIKFAFTFHLVLINVILILNLIVIKVNMNTNNRSIHFNHLFCLLICIIEQFI